MVSNFLTGFLVYIIFFYCYSNVSNKGTVTKGNGHSCIVEPHYMDATGLVLVTKGNGHSCIVEPQLYGCYGTGTSLCNIQWDLSYIDPSLYS